MLTRERKSRGSSRKTSGAASPDPKNGSSSSSAPSAESTANQPQESARDLFEQVIFAFILAFVIRFIVAEPFVIPTGSMAPTLMGQHKELECPECGEVFQANASSDPSRPKVTVAGICPNCRHLVDLRDHLPYSGDRILVSKPLYLFGNVLPFGATPTRWDVAVFKYPYQAEENFIKRIVGMPDEQLFILLGDVFVRDAANRTDVDEQTAADFRIARKSLEVVRSTRIRVFDDTHRAKSFADRREWRRWRLGSGWSQPEPARYQIDRDGGEPPARLTYHHLIPSQIQWTLALNGEADLGDPQPSLITDVTGYNMAFQVSPTEVSRQQVREEAQHFRLHWVGDLTLEATLDVQRIGADARIDLELVEAGTVHQAQLNLADGRVAVLRGDTLLAEASMPRLREPGTHKVFFANVDDQLMLVVDNQRPLGDSVPYERRPASNRLGPTTEDLEPARIAVQDVSVAVTDLLLGRDIYYTKKPGESDYPRFNALSSAQALEFFSDPNQFAQIARTEPSRIYTISPDCYMMMGDNSPMSSDARDWVGKDQADLLRNPEYAKYEVPESMIVGKAFLIFWPHAWPVEPHITLPRIGDIPFVPYFSRMGRIR